MEKNFLSHGFFSIFFSPFSSPPFTGVGLRARQIEDALSGKKGYACMSSLFCVRM